MYLSLSRDGSTMGFASPKELRDALVESEPEKFSRAERVRHALPTGARRLAVMDADEMRELGRGRLGFLRAEARAEDYAARRSYR